MDTDLMYMTISGVFDEIVRPELRSQYEGGRKAKFLSISKYHNQMPGLFQAKFQDKRMITLTSKCYYTDSTGLWPMESQQASPNPR